ncbi:MAG TPA: glycosyltransferase family 2 protein [Gemmatimonadaceae bacterium]|jgi:GT2 family glycosyltransferase|nr:glycosyltransferase family 2 protein [Gemmatimonadaceae bacterium]
MTDVVAVIGNYQGEHVLPDCLASLHEQSHRLTEVIVVDGSSTDGGAVLAERYGARVLRHPNHGLGFLYNRGAEAAIAPYVLFLNNDVSLDSRCVELLAAALDEDQARFAADAQQFDWAGVSTIHARTTVTRGRLLREFLPGLHLDSRIPAEEVVATVSANGAAMLVRRATHLELGGFDETFFMEWEDLDLCWRAWLGGWSSVYVPQARVRHRVGSATYEGRAQGRREASSHHNLLRFALKCLPAAAAARVVAGELLRLPRHPKPIAHGFATVVRELPDIARLRRMLAPSRKLNGAPISL